MFLNFELFGLMGLFVLFRFELKYFDPFLVLDEFSGGYINIIYVSVSFCL